MARSEVKRGTNASDFRTARGRTAGPSRSPSVHSEFPNSLETFDSTSNFGSSSFVFSLRRDFRPESRRGGARAHTLADYLLNLSILISKGKENKSESSSNGE
jgi:hypothetical protein